MCIRDIGRVARWGRWSPIGSTIRNLTVRSDHPPEYLDSEMIAQGWDRLVEMQRAAWVEELHDLTTRRAEIQVRIDDYQSQLPVEQSPKASSHPPWKNPPAIGARPPLSVWPLRVKSPPSQGELEQMRNLRSAESKKCPPPPRPSQAAGVGVAIAKPNMPIGSVPLRGPPQCLFPVSPLVTSDVRVKPIDPSAQGAAIGPGPPGPE